MTHNQVIMTSLGRRPHVQRILETPGTIKIFLRIETRLHKSPDPSPIKLSVLTPNARCSPNKIRLGFV